MWKNYDVTQERGISDYSMCIIENIYQKTGTSSLEALFELVWAFYGIIIKFASEEYFEWQSQQSIKPRKNK